MMSDASLFDFSTDDNFHLLMIDRSVRNHGRYAVPHSIDAYSKINLSETTGCEIMVVRSLAKIAQ